MKVDLNRILEERARMLSKFSHLAESAGANSSSLPVALGVSADVLSDWNPLFERSFGKVASESKQLQEALERSGLADFGFDSADEESLSGALTLLRGVAGELVVNDSLTAGDFPGPQGSESVELLGFYEPGADIRFVIEGETVDANVKIASSSGPIVNHFNSHPHVPVVFASTDAASEAREVGFNVVDGRYSFPWPVGEPLVVDIGLTSEEIERSLTAELNSSISSSAWVEKIPFATVAMIIIRAATALRRGEKLGEVALRARRDTAAGAVGLATGHLLSSAGVVEPVSAAMALLGTSLWRTSMEVRASWGEAVTGDLILRHRAVSLMRSQCL